MIQQLRVAGLSMVQDDAHHAPDGWTHRLTMPRAGTHPRSVQELVDIGGTAPDAYLAVPSA